MKKIISLLVLGLSAIMLVACSGSSDSKLGSSPEVQLDGTWYEFYKTEKGDNYHIVRMDYGSAKIDNDTLVFTGETYTINKENKTLKKDSKIFDYTVKSGILSFDKKTFVKKDSAQYKKMVEEGADLGEESK